MTALDARRATRRYLTLTALRWLPSGLLLPVFVLLPLERGLTLPQVGLAFAVQGLVVLALELPTGGLADSLGRRPVLVLAAAAQVLSLLLFVTATSMTAFTVAFAVQGVYRALDSGPLEAWYVDAVLAADPRARLERGLSAGGTALGLAVAAGALVSGGLVALDPVPDLLPAVAVPAVVAAGLALLNLAAVAVLLTPGSPRGRRGSFGASVRTVPAVIGGGLRLLRRSRVLTALVLVEVSWGFGMVAFETLTPVRLEELLGSSAAAGALMGPAASAAWVASAAGAALVAALGPRLDVALTAGLLRLLQGATVVVMGLAAGAPGVLAGFLACYVVHGASNPLHMTLLHGQVDSGHRSTVVSLNSMVSQPAGALGGIVLTALAAAVSTSAAMLVGGAVLALAAPLYLPARRAARERAASPVRQAPALTPET
ncbi:MAG TPA: MFS transporter [Jiangellales bacterium]|nr:MFS transporter [Jiangellales bacterium]